ncbi:MAG: diaminopimelate decarboxylase [Bacteriovoracaceae bacterium]|nr:diaminopimelate decarboxylase [Bacteriovoracaceae bacterium]
MNYDYKNFASEYGTPLYIYDKSKIESNYKKLKSAFEDHYSHFSIHYAVKANPNPAVIKVLGDMGSGVDCSSPGELEHALRAGISPDKVLYTGNYESPDDLSRVIKNDIKINFDDLNSFKRMIKLGKPKRVSFRINPGIGKGSHEAVVTGGTDAKFGIPYEKAFEAYEFAKENGVEKFGIHMMTGSNNLEPFFFAEAVEKLLTIGGEIFNRLDIAPDYVDIGGGFGIPYHPEDTPLDVNLMAKLICEKFKAGVAKYKLGNPELLVEPGRYLVGNAGVLLASVTGLKESYRNFVGIDAGMNTLARPSLYGAIHQVEFPYKKNSETKVMSVCGQVCENADILAHNIHLPVDIEEGDLMILRDAGAYGFAMSSVYNGRPRPAEVLVDGESSKLIRRRELIEDLFNYYC